MKLDEIRVKFCTECKYILNPGNKQKCIKCNGVLLKTRYLYFVKEALR